ncbi:HIT family protein [Leekyejoonella antrihumi]|uniref:HIT family protein n=1 Tax=Leekyejoonella antrihumi TaxID=1660198 RepID=A0A563DYH3_9MICO|nr:HIT family protein [Leekyejoonella antrihumi]TWP35169.1 HIT family protein [Leekyejoonella antrihumi]
MCIFCDIVEHRVDANIVRATSTTVTFLDRRPVFKGHVLVVPRIHVVTLPDLPADAVGAFFRDVQAASDVLPQACDAQGSFVAINNVVSQSVAHLHCHVVPRTKGDGLRGFFWPRTRYAVGEADAYASRIAAAFGARGW